MATSTITWDNLGSSTKFADYEKVIKDTAFNKHLLFLKLRSKKKTYSGGLNVTEPIQTDESDGGSFTGYAEFDIGEKQLFETVVLQPAYYETHMSIAMTDMDKNRGDAAIFDLMEAKYENARRTLEKKLNTGLFTTATATPSTAPLVGLDSIMISTPTTGTYGNIARNSTNWKNQYRDFSTLSGVTMLDLQQLWGDCSDGTIHPDIIICPQDFYDQIWSLADGRQRLGNEEAAKLGYQSIDFNGVPMIVDKACPAGKVYMINSDFLYLKESDNMNFTATPWLQPSRQLVKVKYLTWGGQLVCSNLRYQGLGEYS